MSMTYIDFRNAIGFKESSNRYDVINPLGYLGRYQFGTARLSDFGLCARKTGTTGFGNDDFDWVAPFTQSNFLASPALQDACFDLHVWRFQELISKQYGGRLGDMSNGIVVLMSGAVACCHLLGQGGLDDFFKGTIDKDANGETATSYICQFNSYQMLTTAPTSNLKYLTALLSQPAQTQGATGLSPVAPVVAISFWGQFALFLKSLFKRSG